MVFRLNLTCSSFHKITRVHYRRKLKGNTLPVKFSTALKDQFKVNSAFDEDLFWEMANETIQNIHECLILGQYKARVSY